jgi:hypothetical protein
MEIALMAKRQNSGGMGLSRREAIPLLGAVALGIGSVLRKEIGLIDFCYLEDN